MVLVAFVSHDPNGTDSPLARRSASHALETIFLFFDDHEAKQQRTVTTDGDRDGDRRHTHNAMASMSAKPTMMDKHGMISPRFLELFFVDWELGISNACHRHV